jgi:hypothetical protein
MSFRDGEKNQCNWFSPQITASLASPTRALRILRVLPGRGTERVARPRSVSPVPALCRGLVIYVPRSVFDEETHYG